MPQIIGIVLIIFGIVGLIGSLTLFWWLTRAQGPIEQFRQRLLRLSSQLHEGSVSVQTALQTAQAARALLLDFRSKAQEISGLIIQLKDQFFLGLDLADQTRLRFETIEVRKIDSLNITNLPQVGVSLPIITNVSLGETKLPGSDIKVATPPLKVERGTFSLNFPPTPVVSGVNLISTYPLQELSQLSSIARQYLTAITEILGHIGTTLVETGNPLTEVRTRLDELINNVLSPLQLSLEEGSLEARQAANSPWLFFGPLFVFGYLSLLHVAFALTGLALLFV